MYLVVLVFRDGRIVYKPFLEFTFAKLKIKSILD